MKKAFSLILGTIALSFCLASLGAAQSSAHQPKVFKLEVKSSKQVYQLGEPVDLTYTLVNVSNKEIPFDGCFSASTGEIQLFISEGKDNFLEFDCQCGFVDLSCPATFLKTNEKLEFSAKILWNYKPEETNRINPDVYVWLKTIKIWNAFAFHNPGIHYLKVRDNDLESEPIQITITEPVGEDLKVWNKIKDSDDFAYLIERSDLLIPYDKLKERAEFQQQVEAIIKEHPNSFLVNLLRQSLDTFKASEAKRPKNLFHQKQ